MLIAANALLLLLAPAQGAELAVLPVGLGAIEPPVAASLVILKQLRQRDPAVLSQDELLELLARDRRAAPIDEVAVAKMLDAVSRGEWDRQDTAQELTQTVEGLAQDRAPTVSRTRLLQRGRLLLARALHDRAALLREPGQRREVQQALERHLEAAVRADPRITMPLETFSPPLRRELDLARRRVDQGPKGRLEVRADRQDAQIFLEGREVGAGSGYSDAALPVGTYRVWLKSGDCRSRTHRIEVGTRPVHVDAELDLDCLLDGQAGALRLPEATPIRDTLALGLARLLEVESLVLVGEQLQADGAWIVATRYSAAARARTHCVAVHVRELKSAPWAELLAPAAATPGGACPAEQDWPVEPQAATSTSTSAVAASQSADSTWPLLAGAAGSGALGLAGGITAVVGLLVWQDAYARIDRGESDGDALYRSASMGWTATWIGAALGLAGTLGAAGLGGWALLAADPEPELESAPGQPLPR